MPAARIGLARRHRQVFPHREALEDAAALRHERHAARRDLSGGSFVTAVPNTSTAPLRGGRSPTVTFMQVDLAGAVAPQQAQQPAFASANDTFCSTWLSP